MDSEIETSLDFTFNGTAKEWFGIWIVNLLLSIVTIGIYSAWAKVRTKSIFTGIPLLGDATLTITPWGANSRRAFNRCRRYCRLSDHLDVTALRRFSALLWLDFAFSMA